MKYILVILLITISQIVSSQELSEVPAVSSMKISLEEAKEIFNFRQFTFSDGTKVKMIVLPRDSSSSRIFIKEIGLTPSRFYEKADSAFSTGRLNLLKIVEDDRELVSDVSKTVGAIGYAKKFIAINYRNSVYIIER